MDDIEKTLLMLDIIDQLELADAEIDALQAVLSHVADQNWVNETVARLRVRPKAHAARRAKYDQLRALISAAPSKKEAPSLPAVLPKPGGKPN